MDFLFIHDGLDLHASDYTSYVGVTSKYFGLADLHNKIARMDVLALTKSVR